MREPSSIDPPPASDARPADVPAPPVPAADARAGRMRELGIVAAFALGTMLLVGVVLWMALGGAQKPRGATASSAAHASAPPTQLPAGAPVPDRCLVAAADGRILGRVVAEMGSGDQTTTYRVEEYPGHGVAPAASTLEVPAAGARLVPCASLAAKPAAR